jgi:hypothetical protein
VKQIIRIALGDKDLEDEEMLEWARMCAAAAMSIISAIGDDDVFEEAIAKLSANDQVVQREIRAAVDRLTHIDDEATSFKEALARETRQYPTGGEGAGAPGEGIQELDRQTAATVQQSCPRFAARERPFNQPF